MMRQVAPSFSTPDPQQDSFGRRRWIPLKRILVDSEYYLPYASFRIAGEWFDSFGNLMAILAGVADDTPAPPVSWTSSHVTAWRNTP